MTADRKSDSEMVEQVARALSEYSAPNVPFENYGPDYQKAKRKEARVAIEAMREPTDEMIVELTTTIVGFIEEKDGPSVEDIWNAMIDVALKDQSPEISVP